MLRISKIDEIAISVLAPGHAEDLLATIKARGIEILAHCCVSAPLGALTLVVTDKPQRAKVVLEQAGHKCKTSPVVLVRTPRRTTFAAQLGMQLTAAQIGIRYYYATPPEATQAHVVFKTTDDDHAIRVLQTCASKMNERIKWQLAQQRFEITKRQAEHSL
jgi:hypothetical protein